MARYAALKLRMAPALAKALKLRFDDQTGRPAAMSAARSTREAREIQAAWKWIDRHYQDRIAPLFQTEKAPAVEACHHEPKTAPSHRSAFVRPGDALKNSINRQRSIAPLDLISAGPSLKISYSNTPRPDYSPGFKFVDGFRLRGDVYMEWDGLCLVLGRYDGDSALQVEADTPEDALEVLRKAQDSGEIPEAFLRSVPRSGYRHKMFMV